MSFKLHKKQQANFLTFQVHPSLAGVGYGSSVVAAIVGSYYNVIIAWCLFYFLSSLRATLPWAACPLDSISGSGNTSVAECEMSSETQYFWFRTTLDTSDSIGTGCFFFFGFSQGAVKQLYQGFFGSFCTFCIAKYGRTFILVLLTNRNKKKVDKFHL